MLYPFVLIAAAVFRVAAVDPLSATAAVVDVQLVTSPAVPIAAGPAVLARGLPESIQHFRFNAPAASDLVPASSTSGTSSTTTTDEIQLADLALSTLALAVTVDGHVHAVNRETGQWLWTLHDDAGAALGGISKDNKVQRSRAGDGLGTALVGGEGRKRRNNTAASSSPASALVRNQTLDTEDGKCVAEDDYPHAQDDEEEEEEVYIIEPHSAGDIYLYTRANKSAHLADEWTDQPGSLQKLPLSMLQLVALSPFTFPSDSSRMFAGRKETKLVGVDLKSGRLVGVFGSGAGWCEWDELAQGRVRTEEECDEEISRRPEDLLYIARTEYHLSIYSKTPYSLLQTLTYTTYSSSSLTSTLQSRWTATPDSRYLQPMHDGSLLCFLSGVPGLQWTIAFDVPVVAVSDIAVAPATTRETAQPIMFEQPHPAPVEGLPVAFDKMKSLPETTFIGKVDGGLFAMSRSHFPLVAFAPVNIAERELLSSNSGRDNYSRSRRVDGTEEEQVDSGRPRADRCRGQECLVGAHRLQRSAVVPVENTIEGRPEFLGIEAPPPSASTKSPYLTSPSHPDKSQPLDLPPLPNRSVLASIYRPVKNLSTGNSAVLMSIFLVLLGSLYIRRLWNIKAQFATNDKPKGLSSGKGWGSAKAKRVKKALKAQTMQQQQQQQLQQQLPLISTTSNGLNQSSQSSASSSSPSLVDMVALPVSTAAPSSSPVLREISKDLPPLPLAPDDEDDEDSDLEGVPGETPKKKSRRRRGKKNKKGKPLDDMGLAITPMVGVELFPEASEIRGQLEALSLADVVAVDMELDDHLEELPSVDPQVIGSLAVSEAILGYGSHGTVVLRGEFQGRAVAVKRLLKDFVTIATHEVALLQESDDHPNVIRYFCKEQRGTFLYIALELCPASLFEVIDQPSAFPDLTRDLDPKKALRQITSGIRHLHKLKIVHRDIKPQNILVAKSQHGPGVRMLISDFGLCKKLDMDESSFQQTVDHAAGSFGYRAPEVLRGHVDPNAGVVSASNSTMGSREDSLLGISSTVDPSMRLTRSIDIFSLGCIFYYVLTGGEHPFGGRYEREMNILLGKVSLERLDGLGEEALEVQDAIAKMVATDPRERPAAEAVLLHPFFWNAQKRLLFICDASDRFEIMERDPPDATLVSLENTSASIVGDDWSKSIDRTLLDNLGKYRKYDGTSVRDLLRVLRNKKHHYQDLPDNVRRNLGDLPGGFLSYFTARFPRLLLHVFDVVAEHLSDEAMFQTTFSVAEDEQ